MIERELEELLKATCSYMQASYTYEYVRGYPAVVNHLNEMEKIVKTVNAMSDVQIEICEPQMGGEDFAYYLQKIPGNFFFTGAKNPNWTEVYLHHHPKFDIDERALAIAATSNKQQATLNYLND